MPRPSRHPLVRVPAPTVTAATAAVALVLASVVSSAAGHGPPPRPVTWFAVDLLESHGLVPGLGAIDLIGSAVVTVSVVVVLRWSAGLLDRAVVAAPERFDGLGRRLLGANRGAPGGGLTHVAGLFGYCGLVAILTFAAWYGPTRYVDHLVSGDEPDRGSVAVFILATMVGSYAVLWVFTEITHQFDDRRALGPARFRVRGWSLFALVGLASVSYLLRLDPPLAFALVAGYTYPSASTREPAPGPVGEGRAETTPWYEPSAVDTSAGSARAVVAGSAAILLVSLLAALVVEVLDLPHSGPSGGAVDLWVRTAEETVAALVTLGTHALVLGLLPLPFLPGHQVFARSRNAWTAGYGMLLWGTVVVPDWARGVDRVVGSTVGGGGQAGAVPTEVATALTPLLGVSVLVAAFGVWAGRAGSPTGRPSPQPTAMACPHPSPASP